MADFSDMLPSPLMGNGVRLPLCHRDSVVYHLLVIAALNLPALSVCFR